MVLVFNLKQWWSFWTVGQWLLCLGSTNSSAVTRRKAMSDSLSKDGGWYDALGIYLETRNLLNRFAPKVLSLYERVGCSTSQMFFNRAQCSDRCRFVKNTIFITCGRCVRCFISVQLRKQKLTLISMCAVCMWTSYWFTEMLQRYFFIRNKFALTKWHLLTLARAHLPFYSVNNTHTRTRHGSQLPFVITDRSRQKVHSRKYSALLQNTFIRLFVA